MIESDSEKPNYYPRSARRGKEGKMKKRSHKIWLLVGIVGVAAITMVLTIPACPSVEPGITHEEATTIARQRVEDDGVMSLDGRDTEHEEEADSWHIYFPYTSDEIRGGEPHVRVDKSSGEVIDVYYTQ